MKVNLELYAELLQAEVVKLRMATRGRQGGLARMFDLEESSSVERSLVEETFNPTKNLISEEVKNEASK